MGDELRLNEYEVLRGKRLKSFRLTVKEQFDTDIGVGIKTQQLGVFDFRAFLNLGMLWSVSAVAVGSNISSVTGITKWLMKRAPIGVRKGWIVKQTRPCS